jgi:hypothetical protein
VTLYRQVFREIHAFRIHDGLTSKRIDGPLQHALWRQARIDRSSRTIERQRALVRKRHKDDNSYASKRAAPAWAPDLGQSQPEGFMTFETDTSHTTN